MARLHYPRYWLAGPTTSPAVHHTHEPMAQLHPIHTTRWRARLFPFALPARWPDCIISGLPHFRLDGPTAPHPHYRLDSPTDPIRTTGSVARLHPIRTPGSMAQRHPIRTTGSMAPLTIDSMARLLPLRTTGSMARLHPIHPHLWLDGPNALQLSTRWPDYITTGSMARLPPDSMVPHSIRITS
jgi:hypothetical protein